MRAELPTCRAKQKAVGVKRALLKQNTTATTAPRHHNDKNMPYHPLKILRWPTSRIVKYVPLQQEKQMVDILMKRNGRKERGMMNRLPESVINKIYGAMNQHAPAMSFDQVCSLRRHHMKLLNPKRSMPQLQLGAEKDISESARLFEQAVEEYIRREQIPFQTEQHGKSQQHRTATPDFLFHEHPIILHEVQRDKVVEEEKSIIHWMEVKMYYGASTIPQHGCEGVVGKVLVQAEKYVKSFGPGVMVFMMGCGDQLAAELNEIGVAVVDCCVDNAPVNLQHVRHHLKSWCANSKGDIMP
jgi:hypothetical protein